MATTVEEGQCAIFTRSELTKIPGSNASQSALVDRQAAIAGQGSFDPSPERVCGPVHRYWCPTGVIWALADQFQECIYKRAKEKNAETPRPDYLSRMYRERFMILAAKSAAARTIRVAAQVRTDLSDSPDCGQKAHLTRVYKAVANRHRRVADLLTSPSAPLSESENRKMFVCVELARFELEDARKALARHVTEHGC